LLTVEQANELARNILMVTTNTEAVGLIRITGWRERSRITVLGEAK
jgi:hypothetical protein